MKDRFFLQLFSILGLVLALGFVLLCVPVTTGEAQGRESPSGPEIWTVPGDAWQGSNVLTTTRWISQDGRKPTTFAEWQREQPAAAATHLEPVYVSDTLSPDAPSGQVVSVLVNPALYDGISASLAQWVADVELEGWSVIAESASFPDAPALRAHLAAIPDLDGCLLVGDFPVPWSEVGGGSEYPLDVYYMDLDGVWLDGDLDAVYDDHVGDTAPEIWIGRLLASNLDFGEDEITLLNNYFAKNHAYRTGSLSLPSRALIYLDDDWQSSADGMREAVAQLYPDTSAISDPNTTTALDYGQRLLDYYAWIHVFAHSSAYDHNFSFSEGEGPGAIYNEDIYRIDPHTFFYNLFACSSARFVERNYLSGWYVFADTYGLLTVGSTKSGGMYRGNDLFYGRLAEGVPIGEAFQDWFAVKGVEDPSGHYGLTLHGDPTLTVITEEETGIAPAAVTVTGPTTGSVGMPCVVTAGVDPTSATQPLMYAWQATGQVPVIRKRGISDTATFTWWNAPGIKTITVTASNFEGAVTDTAQVTIEAPEIALSSGSFQGALGLGAVLTHALTLSNTGPGRLSFGLTEAYRRPVTGSDPDAFGYMYRDSTEPGGPPYQWIEIAPPAGGSGTQLDLPTAWQGGYYWPIPLPFAFNFYGTDYIYLAVNSHGTLNFGDRYIGRSNLPLPTPRVFEVETFIAPFWDFLVIDPGAVYYQALDSMFIVEYYQVTRYGASDQGTWQAILFDNGNLLFQYQDLDFDYYWGDFGRQATVGVQGDAITGLQYSFDTPALSDGLAICFAYPGQLPDCSTYVDVSWLSQSPTAGLVQPGAAQSVDLVFDAGGPEVTGPGEYTSTLVIATNDPDQSLISVPVTMTVLPGRLFLPIVVKSR